MKNAFQNCYGSLHIFSQIISGFQTDNRNGHIFEIKLLEISHKIWTGFKTENKVKVEEGEIFHNVIYERCIFTDFGEKNNTTLKGEKIKKWEASKICLKNGLCQTSPSSWDY